MKLITIIFLSSSMVFCKYTNDSDIEPTTKTDNDEEEVSDENDTSYESTRRRSRRSRRSRRPSSSSEPTLPAITELCERTPAVQEAILNKLSATDCNSVDANQLATIEEIRINKETALKPSDLTGLTQLRTLFLMNLNLQSIAENILLSLTSLERLTLIGNDFSSNGLPSQIFSSLTNLRFLDLSDNELTSLSSDLFSGLTNLIDLYLEDNDFEDNMQIEDQIQRILPSLQIHFN